MNTPDLHKIFLEHPVICTDSRKVEANSIFFALKGDNFDGNKFADKALETCSYAVVDNPEVIKDDRFILTDDVLKKLQQLAAYHRKRLGLPIIAITGSNGKTTTKELIARVMATKYNVTYTKGNLNNHIGVPLTLLKMNNKHEFAVIEMGANHIGEIEQLCKITAPDFGIITNVGKAHLEGFGSFDGVKKAKGELYRYLYENDGVAFVNYDNEHLEDMTPPHSIIYYGTKDFTHCQGKKVESDLFLKLRWQNLDEISSGNSDDDWEANSHLISTQLVGDYNFENVLAAICVSDNFNVSAKDIKRAIESYKPINNRSQLIKTAHNTILMDGYNANPSSMKASLDNFSKVPSNKKALILGDMLEMGDAAIREHGVLLGLVDKLKINNVYLVGDVFASMADHGEYMYFENTDELIEELTKNKIEGHTILIKGSRKIGLEQVVDLL